MTEAPRFIDTPDDDGSDVEIVSTRFSRSRNGLFGMAESRLLDLAEDGKSELVRSIDGLVAIARELAAHVDSIGGGMFAGYAHQAAGLIGDLQDNLRDKPVDELLDDGRDLIRRQPALAVGVAVAAGFIAARLVKSSGR